MYSLWCSVRADMIGTVRPSWAFLQPCGPLSRRSGLLQRPSDGIGTETWWFHVYNELIYISRVPDLLQFYDQIYVT